MRVPGRHDARQESAAFDGRFSSARDVIRRQAHDREEGLREGGRWPISVIMQPSVSAPVSRRLEALTDEVGRFAGPEHWRTGRRGTAHLTVRSPEFRRHHIPEDDPSVARYTAALRRAAGGTGPLVFEVAGVVATPGSVMALATPTDHRAGALLSRLSGELGEDGWREASTGVRDFWYLTLLHFAGPIADPDGLLRWVDGRRNLPIGPAMIDECRLIRWDHEVAGQRLDLHPVPLARIAL